MRLNYCMGLQRSAVITVGYSQSVRAQRIFRVGENHPRRRFKKRKGKKKKGKRKAGLPKAVWNPVLANASRKFD